MHIVLGLLTTVVTILYLLDRLGVDLGGLNPWSWRRRRNWRNQFKGDPIFAIEDPIAVASLIVVGAVKLDGDLTAEQKASLLEQFESSFSVSKKEASELLASASHLLGGPQVIDTQLKGLIQRHGDTFDQEQVSSVVDMITAVVAAGGEASERQGQYLTDVRSGLSAGHAAKSGWD